MPKQVDTNVLIGFDNQGTNVSFFNSVMQILLSADF